MSEHKDDLPVDPDPKVHLTDLQWAVLQDHERRRTEIHAAQAREATRFQQELLAKLTEVIPPQFTERDLFASNVIGALLSAGNSPYVTLCTAGAQKAYEVADAMLKARSTILTPSTIHTIRKGERA